ncbi:aminoglycoside phosphotransferase [Bacillus cereus]|nr:aminoglycoside phosphotransferase [Bacillus cereus]
MDTYKQYIKEALPNLSIHSFKQNEEGWDNVAVIVNDELLFRFPRKQEYAMRIPLEKELCTLLSYSLHEIEVPKYHLFYKKDTDTIPLCSYYTLIHCEPLKTEIVTTLEKQERKVLITQLATFLATLHSIPLNRLFENFFTFIDTTTFQNTIIHADFTHHHILFNKQNKNISGIIDFGDAQIGDPAFDFAGLYYDFGHDFTTSVYEQYSTLISHHDPLLIHRITSFYQYSPLLHNIVYNFETKDELEFLAGTEQLKVILQG